MLNMNKQRVCMELLHAVVLFHTTGWKRSMRVNMKQTTDLHGTGKFYAR